MSNKFLSTGGSFGANLTDGSVPFYGLSLGAQSLEPSQPIKTNSLRQLVSQKLDITDINDLENRLNSVLTNPFNGTLIATDFETSDYFSINDELKKIDNITSATQSPDITNMTGILKVPDIGIDRIYNTGQSVFIDLTTNDVDINATNLKFNGNNLLTTPYAGEIEATSFKKTSGTNIQYLMADGSTLTQSANSGNSNFYLYNSGTSGDTTPPAGFITYNDNSIQKNSTMIYISHKTRDNFDIEVFFYQITTLTDVYVQDQDSSANYIQFNIVGVPVITPEAQIAIPVIVTSFGINGFANGHNIFISFFSNSLEIDTRISNLESKTENITANALNTTLTNDLTLSNTTIKGTINFENQLIKVGVYNVGTLNNITNNVVLGNNSGTTSITCENNILIGQNAGSSLVNGDDNIGIGDGTIYFTNGNKNIHIGSLAGITTSGDNNICIGHEANASTFSTGNDNIYIGQACRTSNTTITNSINIGSNIIATNSNEIIIGNSANDNLKMGNSNGFFTGKFRTTGGTSSEFLKANGTTDNEGYLKLSGGTMTGILNMGLNKISSCGIIETNPANSAPIILGSGNTLTGGFNNMYIGKNNMQTTKQNNNIVGYANGVSGNNTNIFGTSNGTGPNIDNTLIFGVACLAQANYAACFGNNCNNLIANTTLIGDPNITSIYPNSLICDLGNATTPFKNIYYSGQLINPTNPILNITNTATLFYNSITLISSNSSLIPAGCLTNVGGSVSQVSQDTATSKGKLFKSLLLPSSTAGFQDAGLIGNTTFLLNNQRLYIGMGFNIKISFGVADLGNAAINSTAGMFVGLSSSNAIVWSASLLPTTLINCIGIGHDPLASNISFIFRGSLTTGQTIATQFNTSTPDNRWFHLSLTNQFNSNNIVVSLTEAISGITETNTFICGAGSSSLATTAQLYPCIQRMMGSGGGVSSSAQVHFGQLTYNQLI